MLAALILFLGITAIRAMPTDIFPEIRIPVVTVRFVPEADMRLWALENRKAANCSGLS
jgi:hypothetical protein